MESVVAVEQLRLDQTIKNLTCGDLEIPLAVIRLGVTESKKDWVGVPPGLVWMKGEERWCDLVCVKPHIVLWGFKDKIMLHCFKEVKCQEFDIRYNVFYDIHIDCITVA